MAYASTPATDIRLRVVNHSPGWVTLPSVPAVPNNPHDTDVPRLSAQWVWPDRLILRPWNQYALFRRAFTLSARPRTAVCLVSADARYRLFVNGEPIHYGPARSFQSHQCVDEIDLAPFLVEGDNVVAAIGHQYGVGTFQTQWRESSGFILDCTIETSAGSINISTPTEWRGKMSTAWKRDVARMAIQMGFQEHFDAEEQPVGWMLPGYEPTEAAGWREPAKIGPAGVHPWVRLQRRQVPLLAGRVGPFSRLVGCFRGENARGYKVADDVYKLLESETVKPVDLADVLENPDNLLRDDDGTTLVKPAPDGQFTALLLETEGYRTGHLILDIASAAGGEIIDFVYNEAIAGKHDWLSFNSVIGGGGQTGSRYRCREGSQSWESFSFIGMRYVAVVFRNLTAPLAIRHVGVRRVHADVPLPGEFQCSDEALNGIWSMCRETQLACLLDSFVDCPWREQAMWWGDARVQAAVTAHAFGDTSILEYGIRLMAQAQAADGSIHAHPPADWNYHRLPDFMATWVSTIWDHYQLTGRIDLIRDCLPHVHALFDFFHRHARPDGLIGGFDGWWVFLDWAELHKDDYSAVLNLHYLLAAKHAEELCRVAGDRPAAERYGQLVARLRSAVVDCFWDEKARLFRDGLDANVGKPVEKVSQQANALAILLNLKPEHHASMAKHVLLKAARQSKPTIVTATPFFYAYVLEAMCVAGLRDEAIEIIREKWGDFVRRGFVTCPETFKDRPLSCCHAWSASPLYHLMQQVLGVKSIEPGWRRVRISPSPGKLDSARGAIPTPHGLIRVEWETVDRDQLAVRLELPDGVDAEFVSPMGESRLLRPGVHEFQT